VNGTDHMHAEVQGNTLPVLVMNLEKGESVLAPHGELGWMTPSIKLSQTITGGKGLFSAVKRALGGGGLIMTRYEAHGDPGQITFPTRLPGAIFDVAVDHGRSVMVHRHGWLCGTEGVTTTMAFQKHLGGAFFGGDGFVLQKLEGQGTAWLELAGEVTTIELGKGEKMLVHPGHVGAFEESVDFSLTTVKGIRNKLFGEDGLFLAELSGPGRIWLQSLNLSTLAADIYPYLPEPSSN
jgi:uncharacterized protein (TIGR00266 family)